MTRRTAMPIPKRAVTMPETPAPISARMEGRLPRRTTRPGRTTPIQGRAAMTKTERVGVYPGTFDPITNGHIDVIRRAARVVDRLVVGVAVNAGKGPLFSLDERVGMVRDEVETINGNGGDDYGRIEVRPFDSLLMQFAEQQGASCIIDRKSTRLNSSH